MPIMSVKSDNQPNVANLVIDSLIANGIDQLYCLPGYQNDVFFDALFDKQDQLTPIHTRHEQGAVYMALGAALATGKPQAVSVVPGPGFLNGSAALATAYSLYAPVLALVGQIPLGEIGKGLGALHEIPGQLEMLGHLTKHAKRITDGKTAGSLVHSAMEAVNSGLARPVGLEVPMDIWNSRCEKLPESLSAEPLQTPLPRPEKIDQAVQLLQNAARPMIVVGCGAQSSSKDVTLLAEMLSAPVLSMRTGHGVVSSRNPLSIRTPEGYALWPDCDVVLALGTRLQTQQMNWGVDDDLKIIHVEINEEELGRINTPEVGLLGDVAAVVPILIAALEGKETKKQGWLDRVAEVKERVTAEFHKELAPQLAWLDAIRDALPDGGIFVEDLTQVGYVSRFALPVYHPRTCLTPGYQGTLGWGLGTGLGAAHARRDVPVVAIMGDGGALFCIGELPTAVHHNIPLTIIVFNDNAYGNVRGFQIDRYNNRTIATDLTNPDFAALAKSFGIKGQSAATPDELSKCLRSAFASDGPTVIEVPVGTFPSPWKHFLVPRVRGISRGKTPL
ncbi:MAG: TPP-binding protein [Rhodobacteraceae bacterium]|nr:TPP-binding protein [Paracoccaceae bacterium]